MISKTVSTEHDACDEVGAGASVVGMSPGAGAPVECISPARAVTESAHARAIANTKRFIFGFLLLSFEDARILVTKPE